MAKLRNLVMLTALAVVVVVVGTWFLLISPKKAAAAELNDKTAAETASQQTLQQQINMLKSDEKQASAYQKRLAGVATHLPVGAALPGLMRELTKAAVAANVHMDEITPSVPVAATAGFIPVPTVKATPSPGASDAASSAPAETAAPSASVGAAPAAAAGPALSRVPITFLVTGTYSGISDFVARIQNFDRALLVQSINVALATVDSKGKAANGYTGVLTASISGSAFTSGSPVDAGLDAVPSATALPSALPSALPVPNAVATTKGSSS